jgi:hypothetical protein
MLPKSSDTDQDITISAFFICEYTSGSDPLLNYALKGRTQDNDELKKQKEIVDLGIEVNYTPNCDIAIDYIRLETPRAQMMFRGYSDLNDFTRGCKLLNSDENIFSIEDLDDPFDNKIVDYQENEKIKSFQKILDAVMDRIDGTDENDFFRMYGFEEEGMDHWLANRYLNKIFNNSVCAESNLEFNEYYSFVVEPNLKYQLLM